MPAVVREAEDVLAKKVPNTRGASVRVLIGPGDGADRFSTRLFTLAPGGRIPKHRHPDIEHEQYMVSGVMHLGLGEETHIVTAGQSVFIPAQTPHWYENRGAEPAKFLCIIPCTEAYETEWLEPPIEEES